MRPRLLGVWYVVLILLVVELMAYGVTGYMAKRDHALIWEKFNENAHRIQDVDQQVPYAEIINYYARKEGINPQVIASVIQAESSFGSRATSSAGAHGLMQIMPTTWRQVNDEIKVCSGRHKGECNRVCYYTADFNIQIGTHYLGNLLKKYQGNMIFALAAYNAGSATIDRYGGMPPYEETMHYTENIIQYWYETQNPKWPYPIAAVSKQWDKAHKVIGWCFIPTVAAMLWTAWQLFTYHSSWIWR